MAWLKDTGKYRSEMFPLTTEAQKTRLRAGNLEELDARSKRLQWHRLHPGNGEVAEERASRHVAHGEKDGVLEAIVAEQVLVEQQNPNVGGVPRGHQPDREQAAGALARRHSQISNWIQAPNPILC